MTTGLWIAIGAGVVVVAALVVIAGARSQPDLGSVSDQWIAQHRGDQTPPT